MFEEDFMRKISIETNLGISLRNSSRKIDFNQLFIEANRLNNVYWLNTPFIEKETNDYAYETGYRIKSVDSIMLKYQRQPNRELKSILNDTLGFRVIAPYGKSKVLEKAHFRKVDLRNGKKVDDGYRGIHYYYDLSNFHYPIEVQWWNEHDKLLNNWLHENHYKYNNDKVVPAIIRKQYDNGKITSDNFEEVYNDLYNN